MNYYLLLVWDDIEPDIAGPFATEELRDKRALELRKEYSDTTGIYMLDVDEKGNPSSGAYSGRFFEKGEE